MVVWTQEEDSPIKLINCLKEKQSLYPCFILFLNLLVFYKQLISFIQEEVISFDATVHFTCSVKKIQSVLGSSKCIEIWLNA